MKLKSGQSYLLLDVSAKPPKEPFFKATPMFRAFACSAAHGKKGFETKAAGERYFQEGRPLAMEFTVDRDLGNRKLERALARAEKTLGRKVAVQPAHSW